LRELWGVGYAQPAREERFEPKNSVDWHRGCIDIRVLWKIADYAGDDYIILLYIVHYSHP